MVCQSDRRRWHIDCTPQGTMHSAQLSPHGTYLSSAFYLYRAGKRHLILDFEEIVCSRSELVISRQQARKFILQGPEAKRKSLIQDVFCLLPGDSAHWQVSTAQLHIVNQTDLTPFEPSILAPNANVTGAF